MLQDAHAFSGFSVDNQAAAKDFYSQKLGLTVSEDSMGLKLKLAGSNEIFIYQKDDHQPATYTMLNFVVEDIDKTIDELMAAGVTLEHYDNLPATQDERGVLRGKAAGMGPNIAWFKDPAGNTLSVLEN